MEVTFKILKYVESFTLTILMIVSIDKLFKTV